MRCQKPIQQFADSLKWKARQKRRWSCSKSSMKDTANIWSFTNIAEFPERETSLNASHVDIDDRHQRAADQLQSYIDDGNRSKRSMHVGSLFSSRCSSAETLPSVTSKRSSRRNSRSVVSQAKSDRLREVRVQAKLARAEVDHFKALHEAQQRKLELDREAARQQIELDQHKLHLEEESRRAQLERQEWESRERLKLEEETKRAEIKSRLLKEETERRQKELDHQIAMQQKIADMEKLQTEVAIRENEEMRSTLGSDYESDEEREDVTRQTSVSKSNVGFQPDDEQQANMFDLLKTFSKPKPAITLNTRLSAT